MSAPGVDATVALAPSRERPMDTLTRDPGGIVAAPPADISTHDTASVEPEAAGEATPTYLHPVVLIVAASGYAWVLLVFWGHGYMSLSMIIASLISGVTLGLLAGGGRGRDMQPWQRQWRSFQEFLAGEVEVWGAWVSGRDAFIQLAGMSWLLAALATAFGILIELARP